jgi:hypothetical protein
MPSLVNTMLTCQQKELNVVEKNTCDCFCPMWKPPFSCNGDKGVTNYIIDSNAFVGMSAKCKRWIPIRLMGCVHMH